MFWRLESLLEDKGHHFMDSHFMIDLRARRNLCMDGQYVNLPVPKQLDSLRRGWFQRYWEGAKDMWPMIIMGTVHINRAKKRSQEIPKIIG